MIFCARATRGLRRPSLDARSGRSISPHPLRENEQAWRDQLDGNGYRLTENADHLGVHAVSVSCRLKQPDQFNVLLQDLTQYC